MNINTTLRDLFDIEPSPDTLVKVAQRLRTSKEEEDKRKPKRRASYLPYLLGGAGLAGLGGLAYKHHKDLNTLGDYVSQQAQDSGALGGSLARNAAEGAAWWSGLALAGRAAVTAKKRALPAAKKLALPVAAKLMTIPAAVLAGKGALIGTAGGAGYGTGRLANYLSGDRIDKNVAKLWQPLTDRMYGVKSAGLAPKVLTQVLRKFIAELGIGKPARTITTSSSMGDIGPYIKNLRNIARPSKQVTSRKLESASSLGEPKDYIELLRKIMK